MCVVLVEKGTERYLIPHTRVPINRRQTIQGKHDLGSKNACNSIGMRTRTRVSYDLLWDELFLDPKSHFPNVYFHSNWKYKIVPFLAGAQFRETILPTYSGAQAKALAFTHIGPRQLL